MHSLIYLNLQFTAIFSHDLHLQYKARIALDFPLHHLRFPPSSYRKKKKKEKEKNLRYQRNHIKLIQLENL